MKVIFIRHLRTPGNEKRQYTGRTDEPLCASAVAKFCKEGTKYPEAEKIVCSPMKRCIQTAQLIYPGRDMIMEPMLRECDFGEFEGKTYEELKDRAEYIQWIESGGMTSFPGGESPAAFRRRCAQGTEKWIRIFQKNHVGSIAFIVHGGTIMAALSYLLGKPEGFYDWQVENGGGYVVQINKYQKIYGAIEKIDLEDQT